MASRAPSVLTDGDTTIANAVRAVWPALPGPNVPVPFVARCEHHLYENGVQAMSGDAIGGWAHPMRRRLDVDLALELIRLHLNGQDLERTNNTLLREHVDGVQGVLPRQRDGKVTGAGPRTARAHRGAASLRH